MQTIYEPNKQVSSLISGIKKYGSEGFYVNRKRKKKKGGFRTINAPDKQLKTVQRDLADYLSNIIYKDTLNKANYITGFVEGKSIIDNAKPHVESEWIINLDIADFFPSVTSELVNNVLTPIKEKEGLLSKILFEEGKTDFFGLKKDQIVKIATLKDCLPQGSPASPIIANIVAHQTVDKEVLKTLENGWVYTRYADDITLSTKLDLPREYVQKVADSIIEVVEKNTPFKIKREKVNVKHRSQRQVVTGIVVNNESLGISRKTRNLLRAVLHRHKVEDKPLDDSILGVLSFIKQVNPVQFEQLTKEFPCKLLTSISSLPNLPTRESLKLLDQSN